MPCSAPPSGGVYEQHDVLTIVTLLGTSPTIRTIPVPARVVGERVLDTRFELRDDGSVVLLDNVSLPTTQIPGIVARYTGDR